MQQLQKIRLGALAFCLLCCIKINAQEGNKRYSTLPDYAVTLQNIRTDTAYILRLINQAAVIEIRSPDSATVLLQKAMKRSLQVGYNDGTASALLGLGLCRVNKGDYHQGVAFIQQALPYCQKAFFTKGRLIVLYNNDMAVPYGYQGKYEIALSYLFKAIEEMKRNKVNDSSLLTLMYGNISTILLKNGQADKALLYAQKAYEIAEKKHYNKMLGNIYTKFAGAYKGKKDSAKTYQYAQKALQQCIKYPNPSTEGLANYLIAAIQNKPEKAVYYFKKALKPGSSSSINTYDGLAEAYYRLGNYKQARQYLLTVLKMANKSGENTDAVVMAHNTLSKVYARLGNYPEAFKHQQAYIILNDSLMSVKRNTAINQLEVKYRTADKDKELIQKKLLISQQENYLRKKNLWIGGISALSLMLMILFISLYRINKHKQQGQIKHIRILQQQQKIMEREQEILKRENEITKQEQEIAQLKAMMNGEEKERTRIARELHDGIGGILSTIKLNLSVIKEAPPESLQKKLDDITNMLQNASIELRKTAHNLMPDILIRHNLKKALEIYCDNIDPSNLEILLQFHGNLDNLEKSTELIIYRITQELIQNITKHANATYAAIQIAQHENRLNIIVEDNGIGFDVNENNGGYGLQNLRFRVQALHGNINVMSAKGKSTTINIDFDLLNFKN